MAGPTDLSMSTLMIWLQKEQRKDKHLQEHKNRIQKPNSKRKNQKKSKEQHRRHGAFKNFIYFAPYRERQGTVKQVWSTV